MPPVMVPWGASIIPSTGRAGIPAARSVATQAAQRSYTEPLRDSIAPAAPCSWNPRVAVVSVMLPKLSMPRNHSTVCRTRSFVASQMGTSLSPPPETDCTCAAKRGSSLSIATDGLSHGSTSVGQDRGQVTRWAASSSTRLDQTCTRHCSSHWIDWQLTAPVSRVTSRVPPRESAIDTGIVRRGVLVSVTVARVLAGSTRDQVSSVDIESTSRLVLRRSVSTLLATSPSWTAGIPSTCTRKVMS